VVTCPSTSRNGCPTTVARIECRGGRRFARLYRIVLAKPGQLAGFERPEPHRWPCIGKEYDTWRLVT
jgi:hypothetical protein